jgi:hypothetical protein
LGRVRRNLEKRRKKEGRIIEKLVIAVPGIDFGWTHFRSIAHHFAFSVEFSGKQEWKYA